LRKRVAVREKVQKAEEDLRSVSNVGRKLREALMNSGNELEKFHDMAQVLIEDAEKAQPSRVGEVVEFAHRLSFGTPRPEVLTMKMGVLFQHGEEPPPPLSKSSESNDASLQKKTDEGDESGKKRKKKRRGSDASLSSSPLRRSKRKRLGSFDSLEDEEDMLRLPGRSWKPGQK